MRDVVIVGGGAAGLSAALTLARARRAITVVDAGAPRNAPAAAAHGLLGLEGINPLELLERGRSAVESYGGEIIQGRVAAVSAEPDGFSVIGDAGGKLRARALLIASGVVDDLPAIPGLRERWGRDVVHCPYCHGWELRDRRIGVLATGPMSALQALMFHQWSKDVVFFPRDVQVGEEDVAKLKAVGVRVVPGDVVGVEVADDRLSGVRMRDGELMRLDALAVPARTIARLDGLAGLGLETTEQGLGSSLVADAAGRTSVPGVWAAGNVVNPAMQVSQAAASGAAVAMTISAEMVFADADQAVTSAPAGVA
jgi:thioredoxin reductase